MKNDLRFMNKTKKKNHTKSFAFRRAGGFTLVELLMVIIIIGIVSLLSASSYRTAQIKSRDTERKANLNALHKSLMMYYNDTGSFPNLASDRLFGNSAVGLTGANGIIYMRETPKDPKDSGDYKYVYKTDGKMFNLFANLENKKDSQCKTAPYQVSGVNYCYGLSSPNAIVKNW